MLPIATAFRETLAKSYSLIYFWHDFRAALVVSIISIPVCMALSIAVGLPPEHGLYTGVVAGIVSALFGGSRAQIVGPTGAFVVILAPIVVSHGLEGMMIAQLLSYDIL